MIYQTLDMELIECFEKRGLIVKTLNVTEGATVYIIKLMNKKFKLIEDEV